MRGRGAARGQGPCDINYQTNQSWDQEFIREDILAGEVWFSGRWAPNRPVYKPEHWDRIQFLDENTNTEDPILRCQPQGITREDPPTKIMQTANEIVLFYGHSISGLSPSTGASTIRNCLATSLTGVMRWDVGGRDSGHRIGGLQ